MDPESSAGSSSDERRRAGAADKDAALQGRNTPSRPPKSPRRSLAVGAGREYMRPLSPRSSSGSSSNVVDGRVSPSHHRPKSPNGQKLPVVSPVSPSADTTSAFALASTSYGSDGASSSRTFRSRPLASTYDRDAASLHDPAGPSSASCYSPSARSTASFTTATSGTPDPVSRSSSHGSPTRSGSSSRRHSPPLSRSATRDFAHIPEINWQRSALTSSPDARTHADRFPDANPITRPPLKPLAIPPTAVHSAGLAENSDGIEDPTLVARQARESTADVSAFLAPALADLTFSTGNPVAELVSDPPRRTEDNWTPRDRTSIVPMASGSSAGGSGSNGGSSKPRLRKRNSSNMTSGSRPASGLSHRSSRTPELASPLTQNEKHDGLLPDMHGSDERRPDRAQRESPRKQSESPSPTRPLSLALAAAAGTTHQQAPRRTSPTHRRHARLTSEPVVNTKQTPSALTASILAAQQSPQTLAAGHSRGASVGGVSPSAASPLFAFSTERRPNQYRTTSAELAATRKSISKYSEISATSEYSSRPESSDQASQRTRTSQATSTGPFDFCGSSADAYGSPTDSTMGSLERDFLAALRHRQQQLEDGDTSTTFNDDLESPAVPVTAGSRGSTFDLPPAAASWSTGTDILTPRHHGRTASVTDDVLSRSRSRSPQLSLHSRSPSDSYAFRGSRYDSMTTAAPASASIRSNSPTAARWALPVTSSPPLSRHGPRPTESSEAELRRAGSATSEGGVSPKAIIEEFQNRWSLHSSQIGDSEDNVNEADNDGKTSAYSHGDSPRIDHDGRRLARLFGSVSSSESSGAQNLETPRGSISQQGTVDDSKSSLQPSTLFGNGHKAGDAVHSSQTDPAGFARLELPRLEHRMSSMSGTSTVTPTFPATVTPSVELSADQALQDIADSAGLSDVSNGRGSDSAAAHPQAYGKGSLPPTPVSASFSVTSLSDLPTTDSESAVLTEEEKRLKRRSRTIEELIITERSFAQDMAVTRDIWLARARGKGLGEIIAALEADPSIVQASPYYTADGLTSPSLRQTSSMSSSSAVELVDSPVAGALPAFDGPPSAVAPQMTKNPSQSSSRSAGKGFVNPFALKANGRTSSADSERRGLSRSSPASAATSRPPHASNVRIPSGPVQVLRRPLSTNITPGASLIAVLSAHDVRVIFSNVEEIASFSESFLAMLSSAARPEEESFDKFGEAFLSVLSRLEQVYSIYCSRFGSAIDRYEEIGATLQTYTKECKDLSVGLTNAWDLPSLLIKPVQRCLKYPLLLQSLISCTPADHPDRTALDEAYRRIVRIAETINELKRRQEMVSRIVKPRNRSEGHVPAYARKASSTGYVNSSGSGRRTVSGDLQAGPRLSDSMSKRFKRQGSKIIGAFALRTDLPPTSDAAFDALVLAMETKQRAMYDFSTSAKGWSKSVRIMLVSLLQLSLVWKMSYDTLPGEPAEESQSARTIEHFATAVVKPILEGAWHDVDQEIRGVLAPKISDLLDRFRNPRAVISKRNQKLADCHSPASAKSDRLLRDSAAAYHALNAQLLTELPVFLHAVQTWFSAVVTRFLAIQTAFHRVLAERWLEFNKACCGQLGPLDQNGSAIISSWWRVHKPVVRQLDSLKILAPEEIISEIERRRSEALPVHLRPRGSASSLTGQLLLPEGRRPSLLRKKSDQLHRAGSIEGLRSRFLPGHSPTSELPPAIARLPGVMLNMDNRISTTSATSAGSLAFSGHTASSVASPATPSLDTLPPIWLGASTARQVKVKTSRGSLKGFPQLDCEPGDMFDVLEETQDNEFALVRKRDPHLIPTQTKLDIGWLPRQILHKIE